MKSKKDDDHRLRIPREIFDQVGHAAINAHTKPNQWIEVGAPARGVWKAGRTMKAVLIAAVCGLVVGVLLGIILDRLGLWGDEGR